MSRAAPAASALLGAALAAARRLALAAPDAWRADAAFRWAVLGTVVSLGALLLEATPGGGAQVPPGPPHGTAQDAPPQGAAAPAGPSRPPVLTLQPPGGAPDAAHGAAAPAPPPALAISPGRPLDGAAAAARPGLAPDRFGTVAPPRSPPDPGTRP